MTHKKFALIISAIALLTTAHECHAAQEYKGNPLQTARGRVNGIDWVASKFTIQWFSGTVEAPSDKVTFKVLPESAFYKNGRKVPFVNLIISDHVKVRYYFSRPDVEFIMVTAEILAREGPIPP